MKSKFALFLAATAMLASCGGTSSSHTGGFSSQDTSVSSLSDEIYLDWVADNKIVIDLFTAGQASFAYGNAALTAETTTLDLNDNASLTCSSELSEETLVNFVVVTETRSGTGFGSGAALYAGIEGDKVSEFLSLRSDLKGKTRAYVAISIGKTVQWTKGKNANLDRKVEALINAK